jgi:hypothetical protein
VVERAGAEAEDQPRPEELGHGAGLQRGGEGMPERDQRAGSQLDLLGHRTDRGERGEGVVERAVRLLHLAVRLEDQVVAHPHGVEPELLGALRTLEQLVAVGLLAEVGKQQAVLHEDSSVARDGDCSGRPVGRPTAWPTASWP